MARAANPQAGLDLRFQADYEGPAHRAYRCRPLCEAGLGLNYGEVALVNARQEWLELGAALIQTVAQALHGQATIDHVGSTAVSGLMSKPILDFAVGVAVEPSRAYFRTNWAQSAGHIEVTPERGAASSLYARHGLCAALPIFT